ncbi:hypothetical protein F4805DRAFT_475325 [Annulohypoxylon moriforme]|nr:hypothetical protein F4805DRAFT_475325 [Annulohypoxylon moriforme]
MVFHGLREIQKNGGFDELLQFYQGLGNSCILGWFEDEGFYPEDGEKLLRHVHDIQKEVFGSNDYRTVETVDTLSRYYRNRDKHLEAAILIEDVLRNDKTVTSGCCLIEELQKQSRECIQNEEMHDDVVPLHDHLVKGAGDDSKQEVIEEWERLTAVEDTRAETTESDFGRLYSKNNLQSRLMSSLAPRWHVWEDSRLYLDNIAEIRFQSRAISDRFENYPVRVVLRNGEVSVHITTTDHSFSSTDEEKMCLANIVSSVQNSAFCQFLVAAGSANGGTSPEKTNFVFWVFLEDLEKVENEYDDDGRIWKYSLHKLPERPEWMVVLKDKRGSAVIASWPWLLNHPFSYSINEREGTGITLDCSYIPYDEIRNLRGFNWGLKYADFMRLFLHHESDAQEILGIREMLCKAHKTKTRKLPTVMLNIAGQTSPTGRDDKEYKSRITNLNVSSSWVDWQTFAVHDELSKSEYPKLKSKTGDPITCLGLIQGELIASHLQRKYAVKKVFVVDAVFRSVEEPELAPDFVFCKETLTEGFENHLSAAEKRLLIGNLNPSLFRRLPISEFTKPKGAFTLWNKKKGKDREALKMRDNFYALCKREVERREKEDQVYNKQRGMYENGSMELREIEEGYQLLCQGGAKIDQAFRSVQEKLDSAGGMLQYPAIKRA